MNQPRCAECGRFVKMETATRVVLNPAEDLVEWVCKQCSEREGTHQCATECISTIRRAGRLLTAVIDGWRRAFGIYPQ